MDAAKHVEPLYSEVIRYRTSGGNISIPWYFFVANNNEVYSHMDNLQKFDSLVLKDQLPAFTGTLVGDIPIAFSDTYMEEVLYRAPTPSVARSFFDTLNFLITALQQTTIVVLILFPFSVWLFIKKQTIMHAFIFAIGLLEMYRLVATLIYGGAWEYARHMITMQTYVFFLLPLVCRRMLQYVFMQEALTIIVPAKHEEQTILATLQSIEHAVRTPHNIIVVNVSDNNDKTADIARKFAKTHPRIRLIRKIHPHGTFGMALTLAFCRQNRRVMPFMADACDNPKDIDIMYKKMAGGWDIVAASRYTNGGKKIGGPRLQSLFSKVVCRSLQKITRVPTSDISNAFKMYRTSALRHIQIPPESGVEASIQLTLGAYFQDAKITEIPPFGAAARQEYQNLNLLSARQNI